MSEPRVSDVRLAAIIRWGKPDDLHLDLRDARAELDAMRPVVEAAGSLRHQCNLPVEDYRRLGGRFDDGIAGPLICKVLAAVDAYRGRKP